jgi:hypothetical protein
MLDWALVDACDLNGRQTPGCALLRELQRLPAYSAKSLAPMCPESWREVGELMLRTGDGERVLRGALTDALDECDLLLEVLDHAPALPRTLCLSGLRVRRTFDALRRRAKHDGQPSAEFCGQAFDLARSARELRMWVMAWATFRSPAPTQQRSPDGAPTRCLGRFHRTRHRGSTRRHRARRRPSRSCRRGSDPGGSDLPGESRSHPAGGCRA